jgi:hypothetical protein
MFSTNSGVETPEMRGTRLGRLALHKGEGEGEGERPVPAPPLNISKWYSLARRPLTLFLSPFARGEATKRTRVGICDALFHEK